MEEQIEKNVTKFWDSFYPWLLNHGIKIAVIAIVAIVLNMILIRAMKRIVRLAVVPTEDMAPGEEEKREDTLIRVFSWIIRIVISLVAGFMIISEFGINLGPLLASAGIVGVAISFGAQSLVKDFITGFFLILENQYRIGDEVDFGGVRGFVEDITLRVTVLRDLNGTVHTIPHGEIKKVSNFSKSYAKINLNVSIAYDSDIDKVIEIVNRVGDELAKDPMWADKILTAPYFVRVQDLGDSSIVIKIAGETQPKMQYDVTGEIRKRIKEAFDKEGIEIPFPQVVVHQG